MGFSYEMGEHRYEEYAAGDFQFTEKTTNITLTKAGVNVPIKIDLELPKDLNNRCAKKMRFKPQQELKDPF